MVTLWRIAFKIKVALHVANSFLMRSDTPYLDPWGSGASAVHFEGKFITQKLLGTPNLVGVGHFIGPQIRIWKDLGPVSFWSHGASFPRRVYKIKAVVHIPNRYPPNSVWPQGQGIGLEGPTGLWKANLWLSQHAWVINHHLHFNALFKTSFESSQAMPGNPS